MEMKHYLIVFSIIFIVFLARTSMKIDSLQILNQNTSHYNETIDNAVDDTLTSLLEMQDALDHNINLEVCSDTFFKSLFAGFGVSDSPMGKQTLQMYVPILLITDVEGFYVMYHSTSNDGTVSTRVWSQQFPYYGSGILQAPGGDVTATSVSYQMCFTMTDKIYLTLTSGGKNYYFDGLYSTFLDENKEHEGFSLLKDFWTCASLSVEEKDSYPNVPDEMKKGWCFLAPESWSQFRQSTMIYQITRKMNYYVNGHNSIAKQFGVNYNFELPESSMDSFARTIEGVSMMAIFQGYPYGTGTGDTYSRFAVSGSRIYKGIKYPVTLDSGVQLYHREGCVDAVGEIAAYSDRRDCAEAGAYPCPVCKP